MTHKPKLQHSMTHRMLATFFFAGHLNPADFSHFILFYFLIFFRTHASLKMNCCRNTLFFVLAIILANALIPIKLQGPVIIVGSPGMQTEKHYFIKQK